MAWQLFPKLLTWSDLVMEDAKQQVGGAETTTTPLQELWWYFAQYQQKLSM